MFRNPPNICPRNKIGKYKKENQQELDISGSSMVIRDGKDV
jgi:hypothetical protein